tara:strand:+ start:6731 stop:6985 length:255 start_codon:yes stop_codon:yes gene_type:complete
MNIITSTPRSLQSAKDFAAIIHTTVSIAGKFRTTMNEGGVYTTVQLDLDGALRVWGMETMFDPRCIARVQAEARNHGTGVLGVE